MVIHAYSDDYLTSAQRILGDMLDFAVNTYDMDIDKFFEMFLVSNVSRQFEIGNPTYVAGKTGCELVKEVIRDSGLVMEEYPDEMYLDKSPEYWSGWALAYYQWYRGRTFSRIYRAVSMTEIRNMYEAYHEMDLAHFVERLDELWNQHYPETNLKRIRDLAGLSQRELAELSGVSVRQIQLFEQRQRDINQTRAIDVLRLSRALGCKNEDQAKAKNRLKTARYGKDLYLAVKIDAPELVF